MTTPGFDVTHVYINSAPRGQLAGYTTGSGGIAWTTADWAAHPGAIHIDQDAGARDTTADVLDVEQGAATPGECAAWAKAAMANFARGTRKGQRTPAIYMSQSVVSAVVTALQAAGVTGVGLWVANWNLTDAQAVAKVKAAAGPYPVIGVQYHNAGLYDQDEFATAWLNHVSGAAPVPAPPPTPVPAPDYHFSATPWRTVHMAWSPVPRVSHYVVTFTPAKGTPVTVRPAAADTHASITVLDVPGLLTVNAIIDSKAVLVGSRKYDGP